MWMGERARGPGDTGLAAWIFLLFVSLYLLTAGGRTYSSDDIARYDMVVSMVEQGSLAIPSTYSASHSTNEGLSYSKYGFGKPLLLIPFYLIGRTLERIDSSSGIPITRVVASMLDQLLAAGVVALLFLAVRRLGCSRATAIRVALVGGLSTLIWPMSKFAFEHPLVTAMLLGAFVAIREHRDTNRTPAAALAGFCLGYVLITRVSDFAFAGIPLALYFLLGGRRARKPVRSAVAFAIPILLAAAAVLAYNYARFSDVFESGYDDLEYDLPTLAVGLSGYLFSPGKGLLVWNLPLLCAVAAFGGFRSRHPAEARLLIGLTLTYLLGYGSVNSWHGDWCLGPRYLLPLVPFLLLPVATFLEDERYRRRRPLLVTTFALGVLVAVIAMSVDYGLYYERFMADPQGARFDPLKSPIAVYPALILQGQVSFLWRDVFRTSGAPLSLRAFPLLLVGGAVAGALRVARAMSDRTTPPPPSTAAPATPEEAWAARRAVRPLALIAAAAVLLGVVTVFLSRTQRKGEIGETYGLAGAYFSGGDWGGQPLRTRVDERIEFNWRGKDRPSNGPFSIAWTGSLVVPEDGFYRFFLRSDYASWLYVDDRLIVDNSGAHGLRQITESTYLGAGMHPLRLLYSNAGSGKARLRAGWKRDGALLVETLGGTSILPKPHDSAEEYALERAVAYHEAGDLKEAIARYERLLGPTEVGIAARAQRARASVGKIPLVTGLPAAAARTDGMTLNAFDADTAGTSLPSFAQRGRAAPRPPDDGVPRAYAGTLLVREGSIERLGITANTTMIVECAGRRLDVENGGFDEEPMRLEAGPHPLRITVSPRPGVCQADIWWQRPGEEREPVPHAYFLSDADTREGAALGPEELAYLDVLAAREYESLDRPGLAARCIRRLHGADDSLFVKRSLRRLLLNGQRARYFDNPEWSGPPIATRTDAVIDFDWTARRPVAGLMSADWESRLLIERPGDYSFVVESDDGSWVYLDDRLIVDNGGRHARQRRSGRATLDAGLHRLRVTYFDSGEGQAMLRLFWRPPGEETTRLIPADLLFVPDVTGGIDSLIREAREGTIGRIAQAVEEAPSGEGVGRSPKAPSALDPGFDSGAYLDWIVNGVAFGQRPAACPAGARSIVLDPAPGAFADSYWRSRDADQGQLVSRLFPIAGKRLSFHIGGGHDEERLSLALEVDGRVVRRATADGSDALRRQEWDVGEFAGRQGRLVITDHSSGKGGHILVDGIRLE